MAIYRLPRVLTETGDSRSKLYKDISEGLMVPPAKIGARAVGFPSEEIAAINSARMAGMPPDKIRALVARLKAARTTICDLDLSVANRGVE